MLTAGRSLCWSSSKEQTRLHSVVKVIDLLSPPLSALFRFFSHPHPSICRSRSELTDSFSFSLFSLFHSQLPLFCSFFCVSLFIASLSVSCLWAGAADSQSHPNYPSARWRNLSYVRLKQAEEEERGRSELSEEPKVTSLAQVQRPEPGQRGGGGGAGQRGESEWTESLNWAFIHYE